MKTFYLIFSGLYLLVAVVGLLVGEFSTAFIIAGAWCCGVGLISFSR